MRLNTAIFIFIFVISTLATFSQDDKTQSSGILTKKNWGFSIIPLLSQKNKIHGDRSVYSPASSAQSGIEAFINYYSTLIQNYKLVTGFGAGVMAHNFAFSIPRERFNPPTDQDITYDKRFTRELDLLYFKGKVGLEIVFPATRTSNWVTAAGCAILYSPVNPLATDYLITRPNGTEEIYLSTEDDYNNSGKPWFNFQLGGGKEWRSNHGRLFQIMLQLNYSPVNFFSGTYTFKVSNQPQVKGSYGISGTYIGLNLTYILSKYKKVKSR